MALGPYYGFPSTRKKPVGLETLGKNWSNISLCLIDKKFLWEPLVIFTSVCTSDKDPELHPHQVA